MATQAPEKPPLDPFQFPAGASPAFHDVNDHGWVPMVRNACAFAPEPFSKVMMNLVKNPNINSNWLFRADILYDDDGSNLVTEPSRPATHSIQHFTLHRTMVRRLIPRNTMRDAPLEQTCAFYSSTSVEGVVKTLVIYTPESQTPADVPFYHPKVRGIAQLHEWNVSSSEGSISVHFLPFENEQVDQVKLGRIALNLLQILHKHGHSAAAGYVKRVHHDVLVPQPKFQDRYSELKNKYAKSLVDSWAETTDPSKHVFEDLGIAAFLIELWADMFRNAPFPGFVDIGCGNGLLVHILRMEGYVGWGFDARQRKSWAQYNSPSPASPSGHSLQQLLLLPRVVPRDAGESDAVRDEDIHDGLFPKGTFIISNHADELTPWSPILAAISDCPFIMIPCCSHDLKGDKFRAPVPRDRSKPKSTFSSLVDWVTQIGEDCGWEIETEMLRIPSTRNTGLLGRTRTADADAVDIPAILSKYGGVSGYYKNVASLLKSGPPGH